MMKYWLFVVIISSIYTTNNSAFSQSLKTSHLIWNLPTYNNAALTQSNFSRITADFRNARLNAGVNFSSVMLWMDYPVLSGNKNIGAFYMSVENEKSGGDVDFNTFRANMAFSKKIQLNRLSQVNFALGVGYQQFGLSLNEFTTSSQFVDGVGFNPGAPNGESGFYRASYLTINSGIFYQATNFRYSRLLKLGLSAHNLNKQLVDWENTPGRLPVRFSSQVQYLSLSNYNFAVGPELTLFSESGNFNGVGGLLARYYLTNPNNSIENEEGKHLNAFLRFATQKKAILGFQYKSEKYIVGFSYDAPFGSLTTVYDNAFEVLFALTPEVKSSTKNRRRRSKKAKLEKTSAEVRDMRDKENVQQIDSIAPAANVMSDTLADSAAVKEKNKGTVKTGDITSQDVSFEVPVNPVYFVFGSSELDKDSREYLGEIYERFLKNRSYKIILSGHTDDVGSSEKNLQLSVERANKVAEYLVKIGIPRQYIEVYGKGETQPIAPNDSPEERAQNRRVEMKIIYN